MRRIVGIIVVAIFGVIILSTLQVEFGNDVGTAAEMYIEEGDAETGAVNLVTAILADYRVYDTLGETVVLFTAILGVSIILRGDTK